MPLFIWPMREEKEGFPEEERENRLLNRFEKMRREGVFRYMDVAEYEEIIDAYLDKGQYDKAEQTVQLSLRQHPSAFSLILKKAEIHLARADYLLALEVLNPLTRLDPTNYEVFLLRGFALTHLEREQEAVRDYDRALSLGSGMEGDIAFQAATELEMRGYYKKARVYMEKAYELNPFDIQAMFELAFLCHQTGEVKKAIDIYERYLREEPFDEGAWNNLGEVRISTGEYEQALEAFEFQLAIHPGSPDGLFNRARAMMALGRYPEAIESLRKYLEKVPDDMEAMLLLGDSYRKTGETRRALSWYKVAAAESPEDPEPCYRAAVLYRMTGMSEEAEVCCMRSLEIDPGNAVFNHELFLIWEATRPPRERLLLIKNIVAAGPENITYWLDYLSLLYELREMSELEGALEDAFRHLPAHPLLMYMKGSIRFLEGKTAEGEDLFAGALAKHFEDHEAFLQRFPRLASLPEVKSLIDKFKH